MENIQFDFKIEKDISEEYKYKFEKKKNKQLAKQKAFNLLNEEQKNAIYQLEEYLILKRLSLSTLKSYRNHLISIFLFNKKIKPIDIKNN